jgi:hypothetical protein
MVAAPAPDYAMPAAAPGLLAHIVVSKYDDHLPLYRQAEIFARDGVSLETSTLSDWVGATAAALPPLFEALAADLLTSNADRSPPALPLEPRSRSSGPSAPLVEPNAMRWRERSRCTLIIRNRQVLNLGLLGDQNTGWSMLQPPSP